MPTNWIQFEYHSWAIRKMITHIDQYAASFFTETVKNVFPSIQECLHHILLVDGIWLKRMNPAVKEIEAASFHTAKEALDGFQALHGEIAGFLMSESVDRVISYANSKGIEFQNTIAEIVDHMVYHGAYHRGNVAAALRQLGLDGVSTDYIIFLREQKKANG